MHREVFFAHNGPGPYACYGCKMPVHFFESLLVHHIDEDHQNDNPLNLSAMHHGCHSRLHRDGYKASDETRAKMSAAFMGRVMSPERRAQISRSQTGLKRSDQAKANMSAAQKGRIVTPEQRRKISETIKAKMTPELRQRLTTQGRSGAMKRWNKDKA